MKFPTTPCESEEKNRESGRKHGGEKRRQIKGKKHEKRGI